MNVVQAVPIESAARQWGRALLCAGLLCGLMLLCQHAFASDGEVLADASNWFEKLLKGYGGKLAALMCLLFGSIMTAIKKDWMYFFSAAGIAIGVNLMIGVINKSFTAII